MNGHEPLRSLLRWPFDCKALARKRPALRRALLECPGLMEKRIAVLGGSTTHDVVAYLELFLLDNGIRPTFYESEYNQWWEDGVFGNPALDAFCPDVVYVHTSVRNVRDWPALGAEPSGAGVEETVAKWRAVWEKVAEKFTCPIIQNNFDYLPYRLLGNLDGTDLRGRVSFVRRLNAAFADYARTHDGLYVNDICWRRPTSALRAGTTRRTGASTSTR